MASRSYNGWSGFTRTKRYEQFLFLRKHEYFIPQSECQMCGAETIKGHGYHAEEYGDTVEDYLRNCYWLCPACHGLLHVRARFPNRWNRYRQNVKDGNLSTHITNMSQIYAAASRMKDIDYHPKVKLGDWSDDLKIKGYKGAECRPMKRIKRKGKIVLVEEDWVGIDFLDLGLEFDFNNMGTGNEREPSNK